MMSPPAPGISAFPESDSDLYVAGCSPTDLLGFEKPAADSLGPGLKVGISFGHPC